MTQLSTVTAGAGADTVVNQNLRAVSPAGLYGIRQSGTSGLTLGFYGGAFNGVDVADGTVVLSASATNYLVANRTTGAVSAATNTTNWLNTSTYLQLYQLVAGTSTFTIASTSDRRQALGAGGGASITTDNDPTLAANSASVVATQQATKAYVDTKVQGLSWKTAVRAASTANGTLATAFANGQVIDGVTLATGDRILVKSQTTAADNGMYTVNASGAPTRATDADSGSELVNASVYISEGTTLADTQWTCTTNAPITVGTTALAFVQVTGGGSASWGAIGGTLSSQTDLQAALDAKGAAGIPQNSQSAAYTLVLSDANKHLLHPSADTTARIFTIPANASVAFSVGTALTFVNQNGAGVLTIAITTDAMRLAGSGGTGNRTLAANGICTALKLTSTEWIISGTGLT